MRDKKQDQLSQQKYAELAKYSRMFDWPDRWAKELPTNIAIIEYTTGEQVTWKDFVTKSKAFAAKLLAMGLKKGDVLATSLPLLKEHVYLMYACYRIGVIIAPLDLRLKVHEVDQCFAKIKPRAYISLCKTEVADFRPIISEMIKKYGTQSGGPCEYFIQFQKEPELVVPGAIGLAEFVKGIKKIFIVNGLLLGSVNKAQKKVTQRDPILIIFTTGSTGYPKPALLCSENILVQNISLSTAFNVNHDDIMLVNLPPSHVGCVTEQLATTIYVGATSLILLIFKPDQSLDAIQKYKATVFGQIPALFAMEWRLPNYSSYDLKTLKFGICAGQSVTRKFLDQLATMVPQFGTGLGLTETAGFVTYSPLDGTVDDILASVGFDSPLYPISIREPMNSDGSAGKEKPKGEIGEICFTGPQTFLGYLNDEESTRKTVSTDGYCYTGDLGSYDEKGLHFAGRAKLLIKPKGYNVFPTEIEEFIQQGLRSKIANVAVVGAPHDVFTEGIIAFVEKVKGQDLTAAEIYAVTENLASYKRPTHVEILESEQMPLNRVAKTDYMELKKLSENLINNLRAQGKWDKI